MTTYTVHTTTCPTAVALAAPQALATEYPTSRRHNCCYKMTSLPTNVRVTSVEGTVPAAPKK